jgi:hypothetical protein
MFAKQICDDLKHVGRSVGVSRAAFTLVAVLGLAAAPSVSFAQPSQFPSPPCGMNPVLEDLCGDGIALSRVIERGTSAPEDRVKVFRRIGAAHEHKDDKDIPNTDFFTVDQSDADYIKIEITLSKDLVRSIAVGSDNNIEIYGVSVIGKLGPNSCYWDCQIINGKKQCTCVDG